MHDLLHYILNIDTYLVTFVATYGTWSYLILFVLIFCETGLIVTPFLPGDSLLFALGSLAANPDSFLNVMLLFFLLLFASILGNQVNYLLGRHIGLRVFTSKSSWFFNKKHLEKAHTFYEKNGGKTIVMARFLPIIRTFIPFVAGACGMNVQKFSLYNIASAFLWIGSLLGLGYFLGSLPIIKENFSLVIYGIIAFSLLPPIATFFYSKVREAYFFNR
jgi:membrane-associated protein